jgi:hypothetical protein
LLVTTLAFMSLTAAAKDLSESVDNSIRRIQESEEVWRLPQKIEERMRLQDFLSRAFRGGSPSRFPEGID